MSDTLELWELCPHGRVEEHAPRRRKWRRLLVPCPGGKKRIFQRQEARAATSYLVWVEVTDE